MSRKKETCRGAKGLGSLRKRTVKKKDGRDYVCWEGRCTTGYDPGTGKQLQRSVSGKTQKDVIQRMHEILVDVNQGTYLKPAPHRCRVAQHLEI